jgi:hypothetical protein
MSGDFKVVTPGGEVRLTDLPLEVLDRMERESDVRWVQLLIAPASTARAAIAVYRGCCEHVGAEPEELTARRIISGEVFVEADDDDLPTMFEDGVPDPKAGDAEPTPG